MKRLFDTSSLSLHQFSPKMYCYVSTRSPRVIATLRGLADEHVRFEEAKTESEYRTFIFHNPAAPRADIISCFYINDLADYDLSRISAKLLGGEFARDILGDSLIALSCANDARFACLTDFWGITTHFWHCSEDTFVCGSNVFLVAALVGSEFSREALYDYLFFAWPRKDRTWFADIRCLRPGQQLIFDLKRRAPVLSECTNFPDYLEPSSGDLIESVETFFSRANHRIGPDLTNYISLSAGSDSRTVLACMRAHRMRPHAVSFGRHDMAETKEISGLTHRLHIPWLFIDVEGFEEKFEDLFVDGTFFSNGLLNPLRTHYVWLYRHIRRGNALFEGILGSEFVKGEIAVPAMAAHPYHDVITKGSSVAASVGKYYPQLPEEFRGAMTEYIDAEYGAELLDVDSKEGERAFQLYLLENIPSRVFSAVIGIVKSNSMSPYYPFLSPSVVRAVFNNDAGMRKSLSVRKDFIGPIRSLRAEAKIVKYMDEEIFESTLDRNVSFEDVLATARAAKVRKRARDVGDKVRTMRLVGGQIDVTKLVAKLRDHAADAPRDILPVKRADIVANDMLARAAINYSWLRGLSDTVLK